MSDLLLAGLPDLRLVSDLLLAGLPERRLVSDRLLAGLPDRRLFGDADLLLCGEPECRSGERDPDFLDFRLLTDLGLSDLVLPRGDPERDLPDFRETGLTERPDSTEGLLDLCEPDLFDLAGDPLAFEPGERGLSSSECSLRAPPGVGAACDVGEPLRLDDPEPDPLSESDPESPLESRKSCCTGAILCVQCKHS